MSELTFADRWKLNKLPIKTYTVLQPVYGDAVNVLVNGVHLPSVLNVWNEVVVYDPIHLPAPNMDWLPFFSGPEVANTMMRSIVDMDYKLRGATDYPQQSGNGLIFMASRNTIYMYQRNSVPDEEWSGKPQPAVFKLGDFNMTARQLHRAIKGVTKDSLEPSTFLGPKISILESADAPKFKDDADGSWSRQGVMPSSSQYAYQTAKKFYENLYGHKLSDVPGCHA